MTQLALPVGLEDHAVFASFHAAGNTALVAALAALADSPQGPGYWLFGPPACGRSHLLQAVCSQAGDRAIYLPLAMLGAPEPALMSGLESRDIVCLDDIERLAGNADAEAALFGLLNALRDANGAIVVAAASAPRECPIRLADLRSRLTALAVFRVEELDEAGRAAALQLRARHRGLELPDDTVRYLLTRSRRDMASLYDLLDLLDAAALRAQRRLTVPFVRSFLEDCRAAE